MGSLVTGPQLNAPERPRRRRRARQSFRLDLLDTHHNFDARIRQTATRIREFSPAQKLPPRLPGLLSCLEIRQEPNQATFRLRLTGQVGTRRLEWNSEEGNMNREVKVSKLDAAKRQLETVIRLYFSNGDPVSIHTLTAAAYNVLHDVTKQKGAEPMIIKGQKLDYVKPENHEMIKGKVSEAENFFKYADRDHEATLDFNPDMSELLI